jgi:hypothetical protein
MYNTQTRINIITIIIILSIVLGLSSGKEPIFTLFFGIASMMVFAFIKLSSVKEFLISGIIMSIFLFSIIFGINGMIFLSVDRILLFTSLLFFTISLFNKREIIKLDKFDKIFLVYVIYTVISTLVLTMEQYSDWIYIYKKLFVLIVEYFIFFIVVKNLLRNVDSNKMFKTYFYILFFVCIYGVIEYIFQKNFLYDFILENNLPYNQEYKETLMWGQIRGDIMRAKSTFSNTLEFAGIVSLSIPFILYFISNSNANNKFLKRFFYVLLLAVSILAIIFTISRSIVVIVLLSSLIYILLNKDIKTYIKISFLILLLLSSVIIYNWGFDLFFPDGINGDKSITVRMADYLTGLNFMQNNFFFGIGYGAIGTNFKYAFDNYLLSLVIETGIIGTVLFSTLFLYLIVNYLKLYIKEKNKKIANFYVCVLTFLFTFLMLNMSFDALGFVTIGKLFFVLLAISLNETKNLLVKDNYKII